MGALTTVGGDLQGGEGVSLLFCEKKRDLGSREGGTALIRHRRISPARLLPHASGGNPASSLPRLTERRFPLCPWKGERERGRKNSLRSKERGSTFRLPAPAAKQKVLEKKYAKKKSTFQKKKMVKPSLPRCGSAGLFLACSKNKQGHAQK